MTKTARKANLEQTLSRIAGRAIELTIRRMADGGVLLVTCATEPRAAHSAVDEDIMTTATTRQAGPVICGVVRGLVTDREAARVRRIARQYGAVFLRHVGPACVCGYGCRRGCDHSAWLELPPGDGRRVPELLRAVGAVAIGRRSF